MVFELTQQRFQFAFVFQERRDDNHCGEFSGNAILEIEARENSRWDNADNQPVYKIHGRREGRIVADDYPYDWRYYTLTFPVARYKHFSRDGIIDEMIACNRRFYSATRIMRRVWRSVWHRSRPLLSLVGNLSYRHNSRMDCKAYANFKPLDGAFIGRFSRMFLAVRQNFALPPGEDVAVIMGLFEHVPVQMFRAAFEPEVQRLGKNKIVAIRDGKYNPDTALKQAQDLIQSGTKFGVLFIFNEEMAAAVVRSLKSQSLLNNPIKVISTNGAPYGIELVKQGAIKYSISSSPGWEGMISALALHAYVTGKDKKTNQQIMLPITPVTAATINDKTKVIPWDVDPVWLKLTKQYFPQYNGMY